MGSQEGVSHAGMALPPRGEDFLKAPLAVLTTASLPTQHCPAPQYSCHLAADEVR